MNATATANFAEVVITVFAMADVPASLNSFVVGFYVF